MENVIQKKVCSVTKGCGQEKNINEFFTKKGRKENRVLYSVCKECTSIKAKKYKLNNEEKIKNIRKKYYQENKEKKSKYGKEYYKKNKEKSYQNAKKWTENNQEKVIVLRSRKRAKEKGLEHNITAEDIRIPEFCPLLGIKLEKSKNGKYAPNSPSIDRIDPNKGYIKGNVMIISQRANVMKNDANVEELELLLQNLKKILGEQQNGNT